MNMTEIGELDRKIKLSLSFNRLFSLELLAAQGLTLK